MSGISHFISKLFWLVVLILFSFFIAAIVGSNTQLITLQLWPIPGQLSVALWLPILLAFGIGLLFGALLIWLKSIVSSRATRQMRKKPNATPEMKDDNHLLFDQTTTGLALNREYSKQAHLHKAYTYER
ncbi:MAG: LapA family protein [Alphaproteobacteria bacterium]